MTINPGLAAFTAVSSAVLIFGNTAHAEGPDFLGYPPSPTTMAQVVSIPSEPELPVEIPAVAPPPDPISSEQAKRMDDKLLEPVPIETNAQIPTAAGGTISASSSGNTYTWGQCTWYAKSKRPDLPNGLGNGGQWVANAARQGFATGSRPRAGAIGEQPGHVVYVESVNKNGTVNISEMNYNGGVGVVHHRTVPASTFRYIY